MLPAGELKNRPFHARVAAAANGIRSAFGSEASFRTQLFLAAVALAGLGWLRPPAQWWAVFVLVIATTLAAELVNTALEHVVDRLHPEIHPIIRLAKDCAAGAVLVMSSAAVVILGIYLWSRFG